MVSLRQKKIEGISRDIPRAKAVGAAQGDLLVVGWGSTYGPIAAAVDEVQRSGGRVAHLHLRYLNPFPANLGTVLAHYQRVLVAENNAGQLLSLLRERYLVPAVGLSKVEGRPFRVREVQERIGQLLGEKTS
jgi:2-oxoglutarate ferredoxin oxidoreductase subunit alpha